MHLTNRHARRFLLAHQNLWPPHSLRGKDGALAHIRRVHCIQYDPLNMAGTSPELVLQARVRDFRPSMLNDLLYEDRALLDGYDKVMSIYPVEDCPYFRRRRDAARERFGNHDQPAVAILPDVRHAIETRGPLSSLDLDFHEAVDWSWAPTRLARAALESMYLWGELVVHHKVNTRKVYDFAHAPSARRPARRAGAQPVRGAVPRLVHAAAAGRPRPVLEPGRRGLAGHDGHEEPRACAPRSDG